MASLEFRPPAFKLRLSQLLSFPMRFCKPPTPTVHKVRSCTIVPDIRVSLDDIIERRHLPPIGLKDFEEWLIFVEHRAQYLYFILWLEDYRVRYRAWERDPKAHTPVTLGTRPSSRFLSIFFTRSKHTFFDEESPYFLSGLPSSIVLPILKPPMNSIYDSPHPDPEALSVIELEVKEILKSSVRRFVKASFSNVAAYRATCGIIGGLAIFNFLGITPFLFIFYYLHSRWWRLLALPAMVAGLAVIIASFHGFCIGIYVFGDLRQLHSFELVRPAISNPAPLAIKPVIQPLQPAMLSQKQRWFIGKWYNTTDQPSQMTVESIISSRTMATRKSEASAASEALTTLQRIVVSEAIELPEDEIHIELKEERSEKSVSLKRQASTASFIIPVHAESLENESHVIASHEIEAQTQLETFEFDGLPNRKRKRIESTTSLSSHESSASPTDQSEKTSLRYEPVPAFGPLTPIHSPIVKRAHWEIVVRATLISFVLCSGLIAGLIAIPTPSRRHF